MALPSFQIEVLDIDANVATLAFYYAIPAELQLSGAIDPTREQFGKRLDATDVTALQNGTIYGEIVSRTITGLSPTDAALLAQSEYTAYAPVAQANYTSKYTNRQFAGLAFDGANWS